MTCRATIISAAVSILFFLFIQVTVADVPVSCHKPSVVGKWSFSLSDNSLSSHDGQLACGPFKTLNNPKEVLSITLSDPAIAISSTGDAGNWTMVSDQGFHITIGGRQYFNFFNWTLTPSGNATSNCGLTMLGWYHDLAAAKGQSPLNWGCWIGTKQQDILIHSHVDVTVKYTQIRDSDVWVPNKELARAVNNANLSWKASENSVFDGVLIKEVMKKVGTPLRRYQNHPCFRVSNPVRGPRTVAEHVALGLSVNFSWRNVSLTVNTTANLVGPLRDQGNCGSCYAHSTAEMMTARVRVLNSIKSQKAPEDSDFIASPQDITSCSTYTQGCNGGFAYLGSMYIKDFGIVDERCFAYQSGLRVDSVPCSWKCNDAAFAGKLFVSEFGMIGGYYGASNELNMLQELFARGPIGVGLLADDAFMSYSSGVYTGPSGPVRNRDEYPYEPTNHAVLLTGYGIDDKTQLPYWEIMNSWGAGWGEHGFIRVHRGNDTIGVESGGVYLVPEVAQV